MAAAKARVDGGLASMVTHSGPLATIGCEPRQARKGATVAADSCAGVWLVWVAALFRNLHK